MQKEISIEEALQKLNDFMSSIAAYGYKSSTAKEIEIVIKHYLLVIAPEFM